MLAEKLEKPQNNVVQAKLIKLHSTTSETKLFSTITSIPIIIHDIKHNTVPISIALYLPIHTSANRPRKRKKK